MSDSKHGQVPLRSGSIVPDGDHVVVHLLQLILGDIERVRRRVELVRLERLVGEADLEGLVVLLRAVNRLLAPNRPNRAPPTSGTFSGSVCDEAASVVTKRNAGRAAGAMTLRRKGEAMLLLIVLDSIVMAVERDEGRGREGGGKARGWSLPLRKVEVRTARAMSRHLLSSARRNTLRTRGDPKTVLDRLRTTPMTVIKSSK